MSFVTIVRGRKAVAGVVTLIVVAVAVSAVLYRRVQVVTARKESIAQSEQERLDAERRAELRRAAEREAEEKAREELVKKKAAEERAREEERAALQRRQEEERRAAERAAQEAEEKAREELAKKEAAEERAREEERAALRKRQEEERQAAERAAAQKAREEEARKRAAEEKEKALISAREFERTDDDTPEAETESTIDAAEKRRGWSVDGDLRPILQYSDENGRDGTAETDKSLGSRMRFGTVWGPTDRLQFGARLAGRCFTEECDLEFVMKKAIPSASGFAGGQFTLDQLFLQWSRRERFTVALGRLQTRFVLRGGVYAKSLDRNDGNNVNVTWTDGIHAVYRSRNRWQSHFVLQRNFAEGTGGIRRGPLDFDADAAHNTYFLGFENIQRWRNVVQRAFDISYLPSSLLKDGDVNGRRVDYWGLVGRLAVRWPQRTVGRRLRGGAEVGYAPKTPTKEASALGTSGDVDGLAWNIVVSMMDFAPGHSISLNYARTGAGWLLSPQFRPNGELIEFHYQWQPERLPQIEGRVRWREDLDPLVGAVRERRTFDSYVRLTWRVTVKEY